MGGEHPTSAVQIDITPDGFWAAWDLVKLTLAPIKEARTSIGMEGSVGLFSSNQHLCQLSKLNMSEPRIWCITSMSALGPFFFFFRLTSCAPRGTEPHVALPFTNIKCGAV